MSSATSDVLVVNENAVMRTPLTDIRSMDLRTLDGKVNGAVVVEVENLAHLEKIMKAARRVKGVSELTRRERISTAE